MNILQKLVPHYDDPYEQSRANIAALTLFILGTLQLSHMFRSWNTGARGAALIYNILVFILIALYILLHKRRLNLTIYAAIIVAICAATLATGSAPGGGFSMTVATGYFEAVIVASLLLKPGNALILTFITWLIYAFVMLLQYQNLIQPPELDIIHDGARTFFAFSGAMLGSAIILWLFARTFDRTNEKLQEQEAELETRSDELADLIANQQIRETEQQALLGTLSELSSPIMPLTDEMLVMPLIGYLDEERFNMLRADLLEAMRGYRVERVIFDLTGLLTLSDENGIYLSKLARLASLRGCAVTIASIPDELAPKIADMDLNGIALRRDLQAVLQEAWN
jgi:anti-anti-sigma regulatory factor